MIRIHPAVVLGTALLASSAAAQPKSPKAAPPDATKLMEAVENRDEGKDMEANVALVITPKKGAKRVREFSLLRKEYSDTTKLVTVFTSPADVRNAAFLAWDEHGQPDRRWLYLPAISQVRRLASSDDRSSFFGTDFVYEDLTNRDPELDTHTFVAAQKFEKWECWVVESTPKNPKTVEFAKYRTWIWKDEPIVIRQEYYDKDGKVIRRGEVKNIKKIQDIWTWHQGIMTNVKTGSQTLMEITGVKYNSGLADERFTEEQLSRGK